MLKPRAATLRLRAALPKLRAASRQLRAALLQLGGQVVQIHEFLGHWADEVVESLEEIHEVAQIALQFVDAVLQLVVSVADVASAYRCQQVVRY